MVHFRNSNLCLHVLTKKFRRYLIYCLNDGLFIVAIIDLEYNFFFIKILFYSFVIFQVVFKTDIYGTFRQTLVYDFGLEPVLSREMQIESAPITDIEKLSKDLVLSEQGRWKVDSVDLVPFENK